MKYLVLFLALLLVFPVKAHAKVNIFACEPEWGALAEEIGGDDVEVTVATNARQDVHHIRAKPSLMAAMRKADLVFCSGAALESGWLPVLLRKAGGPDVQQETIGWLMASDYVDKRDIPDHVDRSMGHIHPEGNPHIQLDPRNIVIVARVLADRLFILDQDHAADYAARLAAFETRWTGLIAAWEQQAAPLRGQSVVVYHKGWSYLLGWLGMNAAASLEPKPGIPPTASHLEEVLQAVKGQNIKAILVAPFENEKAAQWLSEKSGIPILHLPYTVGGSAQASTLESLFNETIALLEEK